MTRTVGPKRITRVMLAIDHRFDGRLAEQSLLDVVMPARQFFCFCVFRCRSATGGETVTRTHSRPEGLDASHVDRRPPNATNSSLPADRYRDEELRTQYRPQ